MSTNLDFLKPSYQRENGVTLGFLIVTLFCSNFKEDKFDRSFVYVLHVLRLIDISILRSKYQNLNDTDLLQEIFFLSRNDKFVKLGHLRTITELHSKETFRKHFGEYFKKVGIEKRRSFTLEETYKILDDWNPEFKGDSMKALLKIQAAEQYTDGDYDELAELLIDSGVISEDEYRSLDKLPPKVYNKLDELEGLDNEGNHYIFCYYIFLLSRIKGFRDIKL